MPQVQLQDIKNARQVISGLIKKTDLDYSSSCSRAIGSRVYLKFENTQMTGSFKIRGASNKIYHLSEEEKKRGVVASSAGNHAQGVALAASRQKVKSKIVMPVKAPMVKVMATKGYGAEVVLYGDCYDDAFEEAKRLEEKEGRVFVHAYDDPYVIAGQGTIGLEILDQISSLDSIVVPIGGGGLISGISTVVKAINPKCKVFGVQTENVNSMSESFDRKSLTLSQKPVSTIADGIAVKSVSKNIFENYISKLVDDIVTVSEDEIAESIVFLMERAKAIVEGSGAVTLSAAKKLQKKLGNESALILSGGNIDLNLVAKVIERGLGKHGRLARIKIAGEDNPGLLSRLTKIIAEKRANILQVYHDRSTEGLYLGETAIEFILETSGHDQIDEIKEGLRGMVRIL